MNEFPRRGLEILKEYGFIDIDVDYHVESIRHPSQFMGKDSIYGVVGSVPEIRDLTK